MSIKITGISSGLDTDSMVQELVNASSTKKENLEKAQTKHEWLQEKWKDLDAKVYSFFNKQLSNLKYEGTYIKKKTTIGDSKVASVIGADTVANGSQTLSVKQLASAGYLTGGRLSEDKSVKGTTTLAQLAEKAGNTLSSDDALSFRVKNGSKETIIELKGSSTINDVITQLKNTGLTASFDETNQRIFISASGSGKENDFSITAGSGKGLTALADLGLLTKDDVSNPDSQVYQDALYWDEAYIDNGDGTYTLDEDIFKKKVAEKAAEEASSMKEELADMRKQLIELQEAKNSLTAGTDLIKNQKQTEELIQKLAGNSLALKDYYQSVIDSDTATAEEKEAAREGRIYANESYVNAQSAANSSGVTVPTEAAYKLTEKVESESRELAEVSNEMLHGDVLKGASASSVRILGQDAVISLNGAEFTSNSNNFTINGLTITANALSEVTGTDAEGNKIYATTTITTADDVDGIYDTIKSFFKEYNDLIKEMDTAYNAKSAKDYNPLTSEEKEAMTDEEVEKWETKIKDSLLRRDSDLSTLISAFKTTMLGTYTVNGQKYSLSSFGIETLGYFVAADNEKGMYHIDGDSDDENTSANADKLKTMIASEPETVVGFFTQLMTDFQSKLDGIMAKTDYRSRYKVYDDKRLQTEYDDYTDKIKKQEEKLQDLEDRYYDQFTQMETAMSKLTSQQNYISSLFG